MSHQTANDAINEAVNAHQIIREEAIRKKIIQPIIGSNPKEILKIRLAKGEITLEEYEKIKSKLY